MKGICFIDKKKSSVQLGKTNPWNAVFNKLDKVLAWELSIFQSEEVSSVHVSLRASAWNRYCTFKNSEPADCSPGR